MSHDAYLVVDSLISRVSILCATIAIINGALYLLVTVVYPIHQSLS
jgi:hypothetical protein